MVLSSKLFDIPGGFHLRVPIADHYSIGSGRLEGVGVTPDIAVAADLALGAALSDPVAQMPPINTATAPTRPTARSR